MERPNHRVAAKRLGEILVVASVYVATAPLGQLLAIPPGNVTAVWIPSGIMLAAVLLRGYHLWPGVFLGALVGNVSTYAEFGSFGNVAACLFTGTANGVGDVLSAVGGAYLIRRTTGAWYPFRRPGHVGLFLCFGVIFGPALSAVFGVTSLCTAHFVPWNDWAYTLLTWWMGDAVGVVILTPFLLVWLVKDTGPVGRFRSWLIETALFAIVLNATAVVCLAPLPWLCEIHPSRVLIVCFLVWGVLRLGARVTFSAVLFVSVLAVLITVNGLWSNLVSDHNAALLEMQFTVGAVAGTILVFNATVDERRRARGRLARWNDKLQQRIARRTSQLRKELAERKRAEEALRGSEEKFRFITENSADHIILIDGEGVIQFINRTTADLTVEEVVGKPFHAFRDPEETDCASAWFARILKTGRPDRYETRYLGRNGEEHVFESNARRVRLSSGGFGVIVNSREVTDTKRTQKALEAAHEDLEHRVVERTAELVEANRRLEAEIEQRLRTEQALRRAERLASIGTLAAGIAHEINNPLHAIGLSADVAIRSKGRPDREEVLEKYLTRIKTEVMRCGQIVHSVLQFARQEQSKKWRADLPHTIRRAADFVRERAGQRNVSLHVELPDEMPQVVINPVEMEQVFVNLLSNAIEASQPGGCVSVNAAADRQYAVTRVVDQGCGMTPEQVAHVFDPFFTTRQAMGGTGLGLSITHRIVQQHQGIVSVESTPAQGTTFSVSLPLPADDEPDGRNSS